MLACTYTVAPDGMALVVTVDNAIWPKVFRLCTSGTARLVEQSATENQVLMSPNNDHCWLKGGVCDASWTLDAEIVNGSRG